MPTKKRAKRVKLPSKKVWGWQPHEGRLIYYNCPRSELTNENDFGKPVAMRVLLETELRALVAAANQGGGG